MRASLDFKRHSSASYVNMINLKTIKTTAKRIEKTYKQKRSKIFPLEKQRAQQAKGEHHLRVHKWGNCRVKLFCFLTIKDNRQKFDGNTTKRVLEKKTICRNHLAPLICFKIFKKWPLCLYLCSTSAEQFFLKIRKIVLKYFPWPNPFLWTQYEGW